jgi:tetratricopeptide (TPR) repeat protein
MKEKPLAKSIYSQHQAEFSDAMLQQVRTQLVMLPLHERTRRERGRLLSHLAGIYWRQGKYREAINVWQQVIEIARQENDREILATAYSALATTYAHSGDSESAVRYAKQGLAYSPHNVKLMYALALAFDFAGDEQNTLTWLRRAITQDPAFQIAYEQLGRLHFRRGRFGEAEQFLHKALELDPISTVGLNELGNLYVAWKRFEEAFVQFHRARELEPDNPTAYNNIGNAYLRMGKLDEARRWFERRVQIKPADALSAHLGLGVIYRTLPGDKAARQSAEHFHQVLVVHASDKARLLSDRILEHDARRALALTGLDDPETLTAWQAVVTHPDLPQIGPGPRSDWLHSLTLLAQAPNPPREVETVLALLRTKFERD